MGRWHRLLVSVLIHPIYFAECCRYTYAAVFSNQILAAATFTQYWTSSASNWKTLEGLVYFIVAPVVLCGINLFGVFVSFKTWLATNQYRLTSAVVWCD